MAIVVAIVAVVVVMAGSTWVMRRRSSDEAHSVEGYRQTLNTLQGLGTRAPAGSTRPRGDRYLGERGTPAAVGDPRTRAVPSRLADERTRPGRPRPPLVFDDAGGAPAGPFGGAGGRPAPWTVTRRGAPRPLFVAGALIGVAVVVGAAVYLTGRSHPPSHRGPLVSATSSKSGRAAGHGAHHHAATPTTTTTPLHYEPVTSTASAATYTTPTATYSLTVSVTSGSCWVQATDAKGTTVFAQSVAAGTSHTLTLSGPATVQLGAPSDVEVSVDHAPVVLPTGYRGPFTMTFKPAGTTAGTGTGAS